MAYPFSKRILARSTSTDKIVASVATHTPAVAAKLANELAPHLEPGEVMPDFGLVITLFGRHLDHTRVAMNEAEQAHQAELADDPRPRADRNEINTRLGARLVGTRAVVRSIHGADAEKAVGFVGSVPENPRQRIQLARTVAERLGGLGQPSAEGVHYDPASTIAALRADADALDVLVGQVDLEERQAEGTLVAKDARVAEYDTAFAGDAAVISGLYRLAGEPELASRLKPSARRAGVIDEDAGEAEGEG